jgi:hypothetical protein
MEKKKRKLPAIIEIGQLGDVTGGLTIASLTSSPGSVFSTPQSIVSGGFSTLSQPFSVTLTLTGRCPPKLPL